MFRGDATVAGLDAMNPDASNLSDILFPSLTVGDGFESTDTSENIFDQFESTDISIDTSGNILGQSDRGCKFNGSFSDTQSKNYLDVKINLEGSPCLLPNTSFNGVGYYNVELGKLYVTALNTENGSTFSFSGPNSFTQYPLG
ncbi:hypothetical protein [Psychrobacter sp. 72-O-c]|uniref:hypothetical protein n=1 Tax=Psychrobacter sp. 72-O-c TaxID=2774125 RepID=UPI0019197FB6|nr:hypothetical protein [Psychrobacter sp. 72-O-c]